MSCLWWWRGELSCGKRVCRIGLQGYARVHFYVTGKLALTVRSISGDCWTLLSSERLALLVYNPTVGAMQV